MPEEKLEKFKFITLKNVHIQVDEESDKIIVKVEAVDLPEVRQKPIEIRYKPLDNYRRGEFSILDSQKGIEITRGYGVLGGDGDADWDWDTLYPCGFCERRKEWNKKLEAKVERLKEIINKLID